VARRPLVYAFITKTQEIPPMSVAQVPDNHSSEAGDWLRGRLRWEHTLDRLRSPEAPAATLQAAGDPREMDQAA